MCRVPTNILLFLIHILRELSISTSFTEHCKTPKHNDGLWHLLPFSCEPYIPSVLLDASDFPDMPLLSPNSREAKSQEHNTIQSTQPTVDTLSTIPDYFKFTTLHTSSYNYAKKPNQSDESISYVTSGLRLLLEKHHISKEDFIELCNFLASEFFNKANLPDNPSSFYECWKAFNEKNGQYTSRSCPNALPIISETTQSGLQCFIKDPGYVIQAKLNDPKLPLPRTIEPVHPINDIISVHMQTSQVTNSMCRNGTIQTLFTPIPFGIRNRTPMNLEHFNRRTSVMLPWMATHSFV